MLDKATVTMPYEDFKELEKQAKLADELFERLKDVDDNPLRKALDNICDLLEKTSKYNKGPEKQHFIYESMIEYCKAFEIPEKEIMEDVPKGARPKGE